jgi:hypothetical protein
MANDSKRTSELGIVTSLSANDRLVVLTNPATSAQTQTITVNNFSNTVNSYLPIANSSTLGVIKIGSGLAVAANGVVTAPLPVATYSSVGVVKIGSGIVVDGNGVISITYSGPYANDSAASLGGVSLNSLYYDSTGTIKIRLT